MEKMTLDQALLRRRELRQKERIMTVPLEAMRELKTQVSRTPVGGGRMGGSYEIEDVVVTMPAVDKDAGIREVNAVARELRRLDAIIHRTNWETSVTVPGDLLGDTDSGSIETTLAELVIARESTEDELKTVRNRDYAVTIKEEARMGISDNIDPLVASLKSKQVSLAALCASVLDIIDRYNRLDQIIHKTNVETVIEV
jgi:hypothetical protein